MFKKVLLAAACALAMIGGQEASAQVNVRGYVRSDGTYVAPHYRSNPDGNFYNNWSTYPNINPYTGRMGTRVTPPYSTYTPYTPSYSPRTTFPSYRLPSLSPSYRGSR
jgi:hypothetical protein